MKHTKLAPTLAIAAALLGAQAFAGNITIADNANNAPSTNYFGGLNASSSQGGEDNETEPGTVNNQSWDMEAFVITGSAVKTLQMWGGYDLINGQPGYKPGDLFIKVGGAKPTWLPTSGAPSTIPNLGGYTFVVDLTGASGNQGITAGQTVANIYQLTGGSTLDSVVFDQFNSNPWRYNSNGTLVGATSISYASGINDAGTGALNLKGGTHNRLNVDLTFLYTLGGLSSTFSQDVWFSYTMECGNDSLKGQWSDGFNRVPDQSSSVLLLAMGALSLGFALRRRG